MTTNVLLSCYASVTSMIYFSQNNIFIIISMYKTFFIKRDIIYLEEFVYDQPTRFFLPKISKPSNKKIAA